MYTKWSLGDKSLSFCMFLGLASDQVAGTMCTEGRKPGGVANKLQSSIAVDQIISTEHNFKKSFPTNI